MRKKIILIISSLIVLLIIIFGGYYIITLNNISSLTYDIIEESCLNNSDYKNSIFSEVISEKEYKLLNVFSQDSENYDKIKIKHFFHTSPQITFVNLDCIQANYIYEVSYSTSKYENRGSSAHCELTWELKNGKWVVTKYWEHP